MVKEATALGAAGHEVTVLTVSYFDQDRINDRAILEGAPFTSQVIDFSPGNGLPQDIRRFLRRVAGYAAKRLCRTGMFNAHILGPATALNRRVRALPWDLLIAHTELPMVIASRLADEGRPVAVDIEDWHSRDLLASDSGFRPIALLEATERSLLRKALSVTTTSESMAARLLEAYGGSRPVAIRNLFPIQEAPSLPRNSAPPSFFWYSQTIGPGRGLEDFIGAWNRTRSPSRLVLLGSVAGAYRDKLAQLTSPERRPALSFLPRVPPSELPALIARHDMGLALEEFEPANKNLTISNKVFQYLNAGLGILATGTEGQREVASRVPEACRIVDLARPAELALELDALIASPERLNSMATAARRAAENEFCWEHEAPRLVHTIEAALARPEALPRGIRR